MQVFCQLICISQSVACLFIFSVVSFKYAYEFLILIVRLSIYSFELILYMCTCVFSHSVMSNSYQPYGNCSPPGSSVHGILQARILEWVDISFFRRSSRPRDQTWVSHIAGRHFNLWAIGEAPTSKGSLKKSIPNIIFHSKGLILSSKTRSTTHHCIGESKQRS